MVPGKSRRVILLGFDAATWDVIDPLMERGELQNFQNVIRNGVRGNLHSLESPVSPRVWTSIVTGKTEDKHGIKDFYSNRSHLKCKRVWDMLNEKGQTSSILYWFVTWPPQEEINGHMVPGFLALDSQTVPDDLSFLKELEISEKNRIVEQQKDKGIYHQLKQVLKARRFGVRNSTLFRAAAFKIAQKFKQYNELDVFATVQFLKFYLYCDVFKYLLKNQPTDFAAILFPQADQIGHKYWAYYEPDEYEKRLGISVSKEDRKKYGEVIPDIYREMDQLIGDISSSLEEDDILMIISDHGFGMIEEPRTQLKIKGEELFACLGISGIAHGFSIGPDYIIQVKNPEYKSRINELADKFRQIRLKGQDEPIFNVATKNSEIILGLGNVWVLQSKDALELLGKELVIDGNSVPVYRVIAHRSDISGDHEQIGIFAMMGKNIKQNHRIADCSVLDITPSILYAKNLPVAKDMDGKPILEAFENDYVKNNPVQYIGTYERGDAQMDGDAFDFDVSDELQERLRALGYMG